MIAKRFLLSAGLALSAVVGVSSTAQAASFTITTNPSPVTNPKGNIFLTSISQGGETITFGTGLFSVSAVDIISNTGVSASSAGGAGADAGDEADLVLQVKDNLENTAADEAKAAQFLGSTNLNNIIDTEDTGAFVKKLTFESAVERSDNGLDNIFFFERGANSSIFVQALDTSGNLIAGSGVLIDATDWFDAGYSIDTTEVNGAQEVGLFGLNFEDLKLDASIISIGGIQVTALSSYNGPDYKVFAGQFTDITPTPEPTTILGLGSIAALALIRRRQSKKSSSF